MIENNKSMLRHTINISDEILTRLRKKGNFGESYSQLLGRILDAIENKPEDKK